MFSCCFPRCRGSRHQRARIDRPESQHGQTGLEQEDCPGNGGQRLTTKLPEQQIEDLIEGFEFSSIVGKQLTKDSDNVGHVDVQRDRMCAREARTMLGLRAGLMPMVVSQLPVRCPSWMLPARSWIMPPLPLPFNMVPVCLDAWLHSSLRLFLGSREERNFVVPEGQWRWQLVPMPRACLPSDNAHGNTGTIVRPLEAQDSMEGTARRPPPASLLDAPSQASLCPRVEARPGTALPAPEDPPDEPAREPSEAAPSDAPEPLGRMQPKARRVTFGAVEEIPAVTGHCLLCNDSNRKSTKTLDFLAYPARLVAEQLCRMDAECKKLRNFSSLHAIVSALQGTDISRLKQTWRHVSRGSIREFKGLCKKNSRTSQRPLKEQPSKLDVFTRKRQRKLNRWKKEGVIPFMGSIISDLRMVELQEGPEDNPQKSMKENQILRDVMLFQEAAEQYHLPLDASFCREFTEMKILGGTCCFALSCHLEPIESSIPIDGQLISRVPNTCSHFI